MASSNDVSKDGLDTASEADLAQAWKDLQKGEQTAHALESHLTNLEKKIDDLLASFEESERRVLDQASSAKETSTTKEEASGGGGSGTGKS